MFAYTRSEELILLQDRGTKKWASLMLPEHVELLRVIWAEDEKIDKPILDVQELEVINRKLMQAYKQQYSVTLTIYMDGIMGEVCGSILGFNEDNIILCLGDDTEVVINLNHIMSLAVR